ncbi:SSI family serine proteinase inhibitor [Glycomyces sp. NPDC048151]|uniref:SSI family serine proteinase inhibitor n=1 Tax=Glycomyces sp. NPDC048151 TaxID=3364002 RepID=UPI0037132AFA
MLKQFVSAAAVIGAAAFAQAAAAGPAQALHADAPHSRFQVFLHPLNGGEDVTITLDCPAGLSEHPNAERVCAQLEDAGGRIDRIPAADGMCTKEYDPVQVVVSGHWQGTPQLFVEEYGNGCEAVMATGGALLDL